jgi:hypothetical protein
MIRLSALIALLLAFASPAYAQMTAIQRQELRELNLLGDSNPGFENGKVKWTSSGGTFAVTSTAANVGWGTRSASYDASASSQYLLSETKAIPAALYGQQCEAVIWYKGGDANLALNVVDGSLTQLATFTLATSAAFTQVVVPFTCPSSGSAAVQVKSTADAAIIYVDNAWLGAKRYNQSVSNVAYSVSKSAVGSVGSAGQIVAGHTLAAEDFPSTAGKIAFWSLSSASDNSAAASCASSTACDLTNTATVTFASTGIAGAASSAASFNGTTQTLSKSDAFLKVSTTDSYMAGGWFAPTSWTPAALQVFFSLEYDSSTNRSLYVGVGTTGQVSFQDSTDGTGAGAVAIDSAPLAFSANSWHFIAVYYDGTNKRLVGFIDGKRVGSASLTKSSVAANQLWRISGRFNALASPFSGLADEVFFLKSTTPPTDDDIRKLWAAKLSHNRAIPIADQQWTGVYARSDNKIQNQLSDDWIVAQDDNNLWYDLSGLSSTSQVSLKLLQNGVSSTVVAPSMYQTSELSAAPTVPIAHGLPSRPDQVVVLQEGQISSTSWSPVDGVCWSEGSANINCDFTGLTIDSTHKIRIVAGAAGQVSAIKQATASTAGLVTSYAPSVVNGICALSADYTVTDTDGCEKLVMTTGASNRTVTLPAAASTNKGRRLYLTKADSGAGTAGFSGTISGSSSNNAIKAQYGYGTVFSDGSAWYWDADIQEQGAWTPSLFGSSVNFSGLVYTNQQGRYKRSGRQVTTTHFITASTVGGAPSGQLGVNGFPYAFRSGAPSNYYLGVCEGKWDLSAGKTWVIAEPDPGNAWTYFAECGDNVACAAVNVNAIASGHYNICTFSYEIN